MYNKGIRVGYMRVSTVDQNTIRQLDGLKLDKIFTDKCSGKDTNRPQLKLMIDYVREGDAVVVHSMDRLARNVDDLRSLVTQLTKKGISVEFVKESLTFTGENTPMSNMLLSILGAVGQFERELINERIREGVVLAKKAGKYKGRSKNFTDGQIEEMKQMVADRYKKIDIANKFGITRNTLHRYLKSS